MNLQFCLSWLVTDKSVSEALIFVFCFDIQNCTQHVLNLDFSGNSMNNLLSYCGSTHSRMRASDTDLSVYVTKSRESNDMLMLRFVIHKKIT